MSNLSPIRYNYGTLHFDRIYYLFLTGIMIIHSIHFTYRTYHARPDLECSVAKENWNELFGDPYNE